jgi:hypothetical protein
VPWYIDATLRLEDGIATGTGGCNTFSGSYTLEDDELRFGESFAVTRKVCPEEPMAVEDAYLANLPLTASWAIEDGVLSLADADSAPLLDFEQATVSLTASDMAALVRLLGDQQAQIDRLSERLDNMRIGVLRDRIKALESQVQAQQSAGTGTAYNAAERVLLKGVPARIARTCRPLRGSSLPAGTVAALQCRPGSDKVREMAYYLMEYDDAKRTFQRVMNSQDVPNRLRCDAGRPGRALLSPLAAEGCFRDGGRANVRIMYMATACTQLNAGGTQLVSPVMYVAAEGTGPDIAELYEWTRDPNRASSVTGTIPAPGQPVTPACDNDF